MALDTNATKIANLIDPEVLADYVESKLIDAIKFSPLAKINYSLEGKAGSTLSLPVYDYIGDAVDVAEGQDIPLGQLTSTATEVKVKKAGRGVQLTDESVLYAYGDTIGEAADQIVLAIKNKIEKDHITDLEGAGVKLVYTNTGKLTSSAIIKAIAKFGEDYEEGEAVIFVNADQKADLITEEGWVGVTEIGAEMKVRGAVGMIGGAQVVVSNRITNNNYIVKRGGLGLVLKRDLMMETDRDIINKSTVITADKHYATYIADASKVVKIANS
jgi:N4-gp56 family major capsid protein